MLLCLLAPPKRSKRLPKPTGAAGGGVGAGACNAVLVAGVASHWTFISSCAFFAFISRSSSSQDLTRVKSEPEVLLPTCRACAVGALATSPQRQKPYPGTIAPALRFVAAATCCNAKQANRAR